MKTKKTYLLSAFIILIAFVNSKASVSDTIVVDGVNRNYLLHVPDSYNGADSLPLVISLHFLGGSPKSFELQTGFSTLSDQYNFIAVYPAGIGKSWNGGGCCSPATDQNVDDVQFISDLIDTLNANYNIDTTRVFVTGFSNGSIMAYRLANELSDKISAIGCVAGQSFQDVIDPNNPVAIIHFHALNDASVNFNGGTIGTYNYKSVYEVLATWKTINNCSADSNVIRDEDGIKGYFWPSPDNKSNIILYTSEGGGHSWVMNKRLGITKLMWEFFETGQTKVPAKYDTIYMDELNRSYKVHLPNKFYTELDSGVRYPLILAFHGWDQNADQMESYTNMSVIANSKDFIVSYLNYVGPPPDTSWNYFMSSGKPNDIGFTQGVLDTLIKYFPVDTSHVYAIGFSDGCGMTNRLPFALPGKIKGIGTVSGMIEFDETVETHKVPFIHINYTGDDSWPTIESRIPYWLGLNKCNEEADTTVNAQGVIGRRWENEDGKNHVVVITQTGGSHSWVNTEFVNASELIWEFFETGQAIPDIDTITTTIKPTMTKSNHLFKMFPNPANDMLFIKSIASDTYASNILIYDNSGRQIYNMTIGNHSMDEVIEINLSGFKKGMYYIQLIGSNSQEMKKLIIK